MTENGVAFELLPLARLHAHEEVVPEKVRALAEELRRTGTFVDPIWVARGTNVILNGHHRTAALRQLGAERIPAWLIDYDGPSVQIDRWTPGPPISKSEVVRRAQEGALFPPQTTRHRLAVKLPPHPTPLTELLPSNGGSGPRAQARRAGSSRRSRAPASPPG
jgi:L-serine kinase (ADP)